MDQEVANWIIVIALCLVVMSLFAPTRSLISWFFLQQIFGSNGLFTKLLGYVQSVGATILKAHLLILKNFAPRRVVLPTLDKTKKQK